MSGNVRSEYRAALRYVEPATRTMYCPGDTDACPYAGVLLRGQAIHLTHTVQCISCHRWVRIARWVVDAGPLDVDAHRVPGHLCPQCDPFITWRTP